MKIIDFVAEDFINYKKPSLFIAMPKCSFKCDKECGTQICQNSHLAKMPSIEIKAKDLLERYYIHDEYTSAIVLGGLEPFDTINDLWELIETAYSYFSIRDDIVIYTGYYPSEIKNHIIELQNKFNNHNIIIKYGRFIPNLKSRYDPILGIELASPNQFAASIQTDYKTLLKLEREAKEELNNEN